MNIQIDGELGAFIKVMRVMQDFSEVQSINIIQDSLKEFSDTKRFVYLSDGVTERKYVIAEVQLFSGKEVIIIEIEKDKKAISTLICSFYIQKFKSVYTRIFSSVIDNSGT